jgi:hypothetical protein
MGFDVLFFPEHSTAGGGQRDYLSAENDAQILVYLVTRESEAVREELKLAAELGLYVVQLARVQEFDDGGSGISELARSERGGPRYQGVFRTLDELQERVREGVAEAVARRLSDRRGLTEWGPASYEVAAANVRATNHRFGLVQDTSSLLLGPKAKRMSEERRFLESVDSFIDRTIPQVATGKRRASRAQDSDAALVQTTWPVVPFIHVFNSSSTMEALRKVDDYPFIEERIEKLGSFYLPLVQQGRIAICGIDAEVSPILVCDDSCEIGTRLADRVYYGRFSEFGASANRLWGALQEVVVSGTSLSEGWPWHPQS